MRIRSLLPIAVVLVAASSVEAATIFTSSTSFLAALTSAPATEDYSSFATGTAISPGSTFNGITYTSFSLTNGATQGLITNQFNSFSGNSLGANQTGGAQFFFDGDSFVINFAPTYAIGVFFNVNLDSGTYGINTPVGSATNDSASYDTSTFVFAGLISDTPFTSATIFSTSNGNGTASYNIPEIILETASVPEPSSITMTALGLFALLGLLLRRRAAER